MKKLFFMTIIFAGVTAMAKAQLVLQTGQIKVVAESIQKSDLVISFQKPRLIVNNSAVKFADSQTLRAIMTDYCKSTGDYKYPYVASNATFGWFTKRAVIQQDGRITNESADSEVVLLACSKSDY